MSDKSSQNDPSMIEILGSIRRIINEDNAETDTAEATDGGDEEILELTEEVAAEDTGEPRPDTTFGAAPAGTEAPPVRREPVLGLHSPRQPDEDQAMEQPEAEAGLPAEEISEFGQQDQQDMTSVEDEGAPLPDHPVLVQEPVTPPEEAPMPAESASVIQPAPAESEEIVRTVISESTTTATATVLGELTRAMDDKTNHLRVGPGETTVSDMVKELLRPMLREWLDENLPVIVERIVRREIQKLVDHAEPDD